MDYDMMRFLRYKAYAVMYKEILHNLKGLKTKELKAGAVYVAIRRAYGASVYVIDDFTIDVNDSTQLVLEKKQLVDKYNVYNNYLKAACTEYTSAVKSGERFNLNKVKKVWKAAIKEVRADLLAV